MFTSQDLSNLEKDPEFQALKASDPARADRLVRFAARSAVKSGLRSTSPEIKTFFERNLSAVKGAQPPAPTGVRAALLPTAEELAQTNKAYLQGLSAGAESFLPAVGVVQAARGVEPELPDILEFKKGSFIPSLTGEAIRSLKQDPFIMPGPSERAYMRGAMTSGAAGMVGATALGMKAAKAASALTETAKPVAKRAAQIIAGGLAGAAPTALTGAAVYPLAPEDRKEAVKQATIIPSLIGLGAGAIGGALTPTAGAMRPARPPVRQGPSRAPAINLATPNQLGIPGVSLGSSRDFAQYMDAYYGRAPRPDEMWTPGGLPLGSRPFQPAEPTFPQQIVTEIPEAARPITQQPTTQRALPAPGETMPERSFVSQPLPPTAAEGMFVSPEFGTAAVAAARQSRINAEANLAQLTGRNASRAAIAKAEQQVILARSNELNAIDAASRAVQQRSAVEAQRQAQAQAEAFMRSQMPSEPIPQPPVPETLQIPPPAPSSSLLTAPPGSRNIIDFPQAPRGFSETAMEGQFAAPPSGLMSRPPEPTPLLQLPAITPSTMAQRQAATEQALYGQIAPPAPMGPRIIGSEAELAAATRMPPPAAPQDIPNLMAQRQAAEKAYNDLVASKAPLTNTRKAAIEQARQTLTSARQAEMRAIQAMQESGMPIPPPTAPKKKVPKPAPSPVAESEAVQMIRKLIADEGGFATPYGAVGVIANPVAAGGYLVRAMASGARGLYNLADALVKTEGYGKVARGTAAVGDFINQLNIPMAGPISNARDRGLKMFMDTLYAKANTPWPTLNAALDGVRRLFNGRFGVPPEMMMIEEVARKAAITEEKKLLDYVRKVQQTVGDDDAVMRQLYDDITDANYAGSDPLVLEGKAISEAAGIELNKLGALSDEAMKRWGGSYLPREYMKILLRNPESVDLLKFLKTFQDDATLSGYYHRGVTEYVGDQALAKRLATGQGWQVLDTQKDQLGNNVHHIWRDWTKTERDAWGELKDVPRAFLRYASDLRREIENGNILEGIRAASDKDGRFALEPAALGLRPTVRPKEITDPTTGQVYKYIGDTVRKGGPVKKYGNLADHYVRDDVYSYIVTNNEFGGLKSWNRYMKKILGVNWWKEMVTIGNTRYFVNNFFVNMPSLELAGGSIADLPMAVRRLAEDDSLVQQLRARGTIQNGAEARELALKLNPIVATAPTSASGLAKAMTLPKDMLDRYRSGAFNVAGATDDMYRVALVDGLMRREGMSLDEAARVAEDALYRRQAVTAPIALVAEPIIPFYAVFHWAASRVPYYTAKNPVKAAYLATIAAGAAYVADKVAGVSKEKGEALRKLLPEQMRDITIGGVRSPIQGLGFPNAIRIGTDKYGQPIYLDMSTWNVLNQFGAEIKDTALPFLPRALSPGGPLAVVGQLLANKELFTARPIVERDKFGRPIRPEEQFDPTLQVGLTNFLARNLTPSVVRDVIGLGMSAAGVPGPTRVQTDFPTRLLQTAGIKARPVPVAEQVRRMMAANEESIRDVSEEQARQRNRYVEGAKTNDQALMDDAMRKIQEYELLKQQRRQENTQRLMEVLPALGN